MPGSYQTNRSLNDLAAIDDENNSKVAHTLLMIKYNRRLSRGSLSFSFSPICLYLSFTGTAQLIAVSKSEWRKVVHYFEKCISYLWKYRIINISHIGYWNAIIGKLKWTEISILKESIISSPLSTIFETLYNQDATTKEYFGKPPGAFHSRCPPGQRVRVLRDKSMSHAVSATVVLPWCNTRG